MVAGPSLSLWACGGLLCFFCSCCVALLGSTAERNGRMCTGGTEAEKRADGKQRNGRRQGREMCTAVAQHEHGAVVWSVGSILSVRKMRWATKSEGVGRQ